MSFIIFFLTVPHQPLLSPNLNAFCAFLALCPVYGVSSSQDVIPFHSHQCLLNPALYFSAVSSMKFPTDHLVESAFLFSESYMHASPTGGISHSHGLNSPTRLSSLSPPYNLAPSPAGSACKCLLLSTFTASVEFRPTSPLP